MKKNKVVINTCYGGFGLSDAALDFLSERGCSVVKNRWGRYLAEELPRHHPLLIECVKTLGSEAASGRFASLEIVEIEGDRYRIDEYDGTENIQTPETTEWVVIE